MTVFVEGDRAVDDCAGETLLAASLRYGIPHTHACRRNAHCSACRTVVLKDEVRSKRGELAVVAAEPDAVAVAAKPTAPTVPQPRADAANASQHTWRSSRDAR